MKYIICFYFFFTACAAPKTSQNPPRIQVDTIDGRAEITIPTLPGGAPFILSAPVYQEQRNIKPVCRHIWVAVEKDTLQERGWTFSVRNKNYVEGKHLICLYCYETRKQQVYSPPILGDTIIIQKKRKP